MIKLFHSLRSQSLYTIFGRLTELMSEDYQEFEDDFIFQLPEMVSSLRNEIFFFEPESKKEKNSEEKLIIDNRKKDEEMIKLREKLSNQLNTQRCKDAEIFELNEKLESLNFQLEQAKTHLRNKPRKTPSVLPRNVSVYKKFPNWNSFEFVTKRKGAKGPSKSECISYYSET